MTKPDPRQRQKILDAALEVFAHEGYTKATIKQISAEAGLKSPALIYWYFKNKADLFQSVLAAYSPAGELPDIRETIWHLRPEEVLIGFGRRMLDTFANQEMGRLVMILVSEAVRQPGIFDRFIDHGILGGMGLLSEYLEHQVALRRLRPHDTSITVRMYFASLMSYAVGRHVVPALGTSLPDDPEEYLSVLVDILLGGTRIANHE